MKLFVFTTVVCLSLSSVVATQASPARAVQPPVAAPAKVAEAYEQFLIARYLEKNENVPGAIAAYRKAIEFDPLVADIPAELAALYLRQNRTKEAVSTAQQALRVEPANAEAHRVLGLIAARKAGRQRRTQGAPDENIRSAIAHLEQAVANSIGEADLSARGTLARLYVRVNAYDKAILVLVDLVRQQPDWLEGPRLLAQAYAGAGRIAEAIDLLDERASDDPRLLPTLADFYARRQRWVDAADTYARALNLEPRNTDLRMSYAQALLNAGGRENLLEAREALNELVSTRNDARGLYMLSQANRRIGDLAAAEAAARRLIVVQEASPWGYRALALALEEGRQYARTVEALTPTIAKFRNLPGDHSLELGMLLPHLGFAQQGLGEFDKALASFDEAYRLSPKDPVVVRYVIGANIVAKKYSAAVELARKARTDDPTNLSLARLEAQALSYNGEGGQGIAVMEEAIQNHRDDPAAYVALARTYVDAEREPQAVTLLRNAQAKFPEATAITFELGAVLDKQKNFADAEMAFLQVLEREPDHAAALNYLGYMLAERGERLDESVGYLKKAVAMEPDNGSFLDSLGWAYFKAGNMDLAEKNLRRAAYQLPANSVIQEHYGQLLFRVGKFDEAIAAWNRALGGDGASIDRADIGRKIRDARKKIRK